MRKKRLTKTKQTKQTPPKYKNSPLTYSTSPFCYVLPKAIISIIQGWRWRKRTPILIELNSQSSHIYNQWFKKLSMSCLSCHKDLHHGVVYDWVSSTLCSMERKDGASLEVPTAGVSSSPSSASTWVESTKGSICISPWEGSILCHFPFPLLVAGVFFWALLCFRKVAPIGAI